MGVTKLWLGVFWWAARRSQTVRRMRIRVPRNRRETTVQRRKIWTNPMKWMGPRTTPKTSEEVEEGDVAFMVLTYGLTGRMTSRIPPWVLAMHTRCGWIGDRRTGPAHSR